MKIPAWFAKAIRRGLQDMFYIALPGAPSEDLLDMATSIWIKTIWPGRAWDKDLDTHLIQASFHTLAKICKQWPVPANFFEVFPRKDLLSILSSTL